MSPTSREIATPAAVIERVRSILFDSKSSRLASRQMLVQLREFGSVAVFGGLLRELSLSAAPVIRSDIDFVISTSQMASLSRHLSRLGARRNRYGGWRLSIAGEDFDIWELGDTWAFKHGLIKDPTFARLTLTTFFDWDAIVFELDSDRLYHAPEYFATLQRNLIEINLEPNANPMGNVGRALDYLFNRGVRWGPRLSQYVSSFLSSPTKEMTGTPAANSGLFRSERIALLRRSLATHLSESPTSPFEARGLHSGFSRAEAD